MRQSVAFQATHYFTGCRVKLGMTGKKSSASSADKSVLTRWSLYYAYQGIRRSRGRRLPAVELQPPPTAGGPRQDDAAAPQRTPVIHRHQRGREMTGTCSTPSPDLRQQINDNDILHPKKDLRHSPIMGAVLTNARRGPRGGLAEPARITAPAHLCHPAGAGRAAGETPYSTS